MSKMKVIIDARMVDEFLHGIARYTYEIIKLGAESEAISYIVLVNDIDKSKRIFKGIRNLQFVKMNCRFLSIGEIFELPKIVNRYKNKAIFHSPSFSSSPFIRTKMIMTIHDLNHLRYPQFYSPFHKYYYNFIVKPAAKKCKKILTVSNFSKNEILEWLKCEPNNIEVTYNGIDPVFRVKDNKNIFNKLKNKYDLPEKFILYVGNFKAHKNLKTLLKAMKDVENIKLVLNGKGNEKLNSIIEELNIREKVQFIGYVDEEDLGYLYNIATLFVFPSLYEGFGLPPLEAMSCGCPTLVSDAECLKEVVQDKKFLFEAENYKELGMKINNILINDDLRNDLIRTGLINSKKYRWKYCVEKTLQVYNEINYFE